MFVRRAEETLFSVVENSKSVKIVPMLCEQLGKTNKNKQSKSSAAKFLVKILQVIETSSLLEPHADALTVAISEVRNPSFEQQQQQKAANKQTNKPDFALSLFLLPGIGGLHS